MYRVVLSAFGFLGLAISSAAEAEPLTFGAVNGVDDFSRSGDLVSCPPPVESEHRNTECRLARTSFGGLPVAKGSMTLNPAGRARSITIALDDRDFGLAYQLLAGRYGPPSSASGAPRWTGFDDGAAITLRRSGPHAVVTFDFPANRVAAATQEAEVTSAAPLLLFVALGLGVGFWAYRHNGLRHAKTRAAGPPLSMRDTLERRMREGDLQF